MSIDAWSLVATVVFGLGGSAAAWYGYKSFQASKEQLKIARDQASQVPRIELMAMSGCPLGEDFELYEEVRYARQEMEELQKKRAEEELAKRQREERERREREERERREKQRGPFNAETVEKMEESSLPDLLKSLVNPVDPLWKKHLADPPVISMPDFSPLGSVYEGPLPNYVIDVKIRNIGRAAAYDVTGWVEFEKEILEPVEHFASGDVEVIEETNDKVKVRLSVQNAGGRLFPSHNDPYTFRVPVLVHKVADTPLGYEFTSPQGDPAYGEFNLLLASGRQQE